MKNTSLTARLRAWLNDIPVQDPLDRHIASLLQIVLIGLIVVIILAAIVLVTVPTLSFQEKINVLISDLFGVLVVGLPLILLRRGYFRGSARIIIVILFITPTLAITVVFDLLNSGGILFQFTLAILLAGLLLSRSALALTFGLSAAVVGFAAFRGQNAASQLAMANLEMAVNFILFNGLIALFLDRFGITLRSSLKMALVRESELKNEIDDRRRADEALVESEERYRKLINGARDVIFTISPDGIFTSLNPAFEIFTGWSRAEWLGRAFGELVAESDRTRAKDQFNRILRGETLRALRLRMHTRTGELLVVEMNISPQIKDDQIVGLLGVARDMTQEQHAEDALKASEKRYRHIFDTVPVSIWEEDFSAIKLAVEELRSQGVTDFRGYLEEHPEFVQTSLKMLKVVDVNDMTLKLYGTRDKQELFAVIDKIFEMENLESFREELITLAEERIYFEGEVQDRTLQGEPLYLWRTIVFPDETAEFNSVLVCLIDITRRKQVEEALRTSEDLRRLIIDTEPECVKLIAPDGSLMEMNTAGLAMIEADSLEQVKGAMLVEIVAPENRDAFRELQQRVLAGESGILEFEIIGLKGTRRWLETHAVPLRNQAGQIEALLGVTRDIAERKHAEEALQKAHAELEQLVDERTVALSQANTLLQTMLDHTPDHVFFKDLQSRFIRNSKSQADMLGLSDPSQVIGKTDFDFFPHAQRAYDEEQSIIRSGRPMMDFEEHVTWPDGRETWVSTTKVPMRDLEGKIIGTFGIARDITDRKRAEEALRKAKDELEIRVTERTVELKQTNEQLLIELNARKQAEEEVLLSQRRLTGLVTSAMDGIVSIDSQQKIVLFNSAAEKMFGYKAEELLGQSLGLILPERYRAAHTMQIDHFSKTGISNRVMTGLAEVTGVDRNGKEFPMDVSISQVDVGGQKLLTAIMRDVTERKRAEKLQDSVYEIARAAMTTQTLDELYAKIQAVLQNLLPAQYFYIALYDREKDLLSFPYFQDAFDVPSLPGKPGRGLTEYVLRTGEPLLATRETTDELIQSGQVELIGADSNEWLGVPLIVRDQAIGVMTVQSYEETIHFSAQDLEVMTYVSSQVASTIERKQAEALRQEAETRYRTLIEQLPIVVYINPASDISSTTYVSPQIQFFLGYTQEEWLKDQNFWQKALHPEDRLRVLDAVDRVNQSGKPFDEEYRMIGRDGRQVWIHDQGILLRDADGQPLLWQGLMTDITERKQAEEKLRESESNLNVAQTIAKLGGWRVELNTGLALWSAELFRLYGRDPALGPPLYLDFLEYVHPEDRQTLIQSETQAIAKRRSFYNEYRVLDSSGGIRWFAARGEPQYDQAGNPIRIFGTTQDITDRKHAEEKIKRQNQRLIALREIDTAILSADSVENIIGAALSHIRELIECQRASMALFDWRTNEGLVFDVSAAGETFVPKGMRVPLAPFQDMIQTLSKNQPMVINDLTLLPNLPPIFQALAKEGLRSVYILPLFSQSNLIGPFSMSSEIPGFFDEEKINLGREVANQVAIAITQSRLVDALEQRAREREDLIAELTTKNAELERFTYTISHDLKSPLVTINGFLGYLEQDAASGNMERLKKDTHRIQEAVNKMQRLLNELLELSRIGRMMNAPQINSFDALVREAMEIVQGRLNERNVRVQVQPNLPAVFGDRPRLVEVMQNLLDNAAKYMGDQPEPRVEIGQRGMEHGKPIFYVKDNGMGVAPEYHERIFGLFNKLDAKSEGTGVGLALVKRIIEVHDGRIWIESKLGQGSTFLFTLPPSPNASTQAET